KVKDLEPIAARVQSLDETLNTIMPVVQAVNTDPTLRAQALRIANGTAPSRETTTQPHDDAEAVAMAEDLGFFLADGVTPDAARGKRVLDRMGGMSRRSAED